MGNYYKKNFAVNSPIFLLLLIGTLILGFFLRYTINMPETLPISHSNFLSKLGIPISFTNTFSIVFCWIELLLSLGTIIALFFLGKNIIGKTAGIFAAFTFATYPYFIHGLYQFNIYLVFSFVMYLLFMYIGVHSMMKKWNFVSGIFFMISCIMEPALLILGIIPYIYFLIKQKHIATLNSFLFFLLGIILMLGIFTLVAILKGEIYNLIPLGESLDSLINGLKAFFTHPIDYVTLTIWPYLKSNFAYPLASGTYSYLHYFIITFSILGILYSFANENIRILSIILVFMLLQSFFMHYNSVVIFMMLILIASFMIDKVVSDTLAN